MNLLKRSTAIPACLFLSCFVVSQLSAQNIGKEILNDLKPVLDCQTIFVANIAMADFKFDDSAKRLLAAIEDVPAATVRNAKIQSDYFEKVSRKLSADGAIDINIIGRLGTLIKQERMVAIRCKDASSAKKVSRRVERIHIGFYGSTVKENLVLLGWDEAFQKLPRIENGQLEAISKSLNEVRDSPFRMAFILSPDQKKALVAGDETHWAKGTNASIENFQYLSAGVDINNQRFNIQIQCEDSESSKAIAERIEGSMSRIANSQGIKRNLPSMSNWLNNIDLTVSQDRISLNVDGDEFNVMVKALSRPLIQILKRQKYSEETARAREIAIGLLKYEEEYGTFPPQYSVNEKGEPMHSWRVLILPYIEQRNLFNEFRMSEPWDSPHNKKVATLVPVNYLINGGGMIDGMLHTRVLAMVSDNSIIRLKKTSIAQITDGTVNTISVAIGSPKQAVPWTKPVDIEGTPEAIAKQMMTENPEGFWVATCDSGVHFVPPIADKEKLAWALQIDDGNLLAPNGDRLAEALAGPDVPDPLFDPSKTVPRWWTDYLIPVPWIEDAAISR